MQVGTWVDGKPGPQGKGTPGNWTATPGVPMRSIPIDNGKTHASKDFWDPVKKRRILWVWGTVPSGIMTVPRVMTYHPQLQQIVYTPVEEVTHLRTGVIGSAEARDLSGTTKASLNVSHAADIEVSFAVPKDATTLSVELGGFVRAFLNYVPPATSDNGIVTGDGENDLVAYNVSVGFGPDPNPQPLGPYMTGTDLPGQDYNVTSVKYSDPHLCEKTCLADAKCKAWTFATVPNVRCCLKNGVPKPDSNPTCTSGVNKNQFAQEQQQEGRQGKGLFEPSDTLTLLTSDKEITVRIFLDGTVGEVYWMGGRVAMTVPIADQTQGSVSISASGSTGTRLLNATAWGMGNIMTSTEAVLSTPPNNFA